MNADRIVVVEHGEVVEHGNHNELIVANGRYADLWSKQVFIKPAKDSDNEDVTTIVDDLPADQTTAELCKVSSHGNENEAGSEEGDATEIASTPNHKKEVEPAEDETSLADSNLTL